LLPLERQALKSSEHHITWWAAANSALAAKSYSDPSSSTQVEKRFKWIWADHGDDISRQYAGTGALKSGFTRTGKCQHKLVPLANALCISNRTGKGIMVVDRSSSQCMMGSMECIGMPIA
jgi:hypothetical protein